jgi:hypothetical protein
MEFTPPPSHREDFVIVRFGFAVAALDAPNAEDFAPIVPSGCRRSAVLRGHIGSAEPAPMVSLRAVAHWKQTTRT